MLMFAPPVQRMQVGKALHIRVVLLIRQVLDLQEEFPTIALHPNLGVDYSVRRMPDVIPDLQARERAGTADLRAGDEGYAVVATIQAALPAGANREFLIGRNEPGVQHYHRTVARMMDSGSELL